MAQFVTTDVNYHILTSVADFPTLLSIILTSKAFHSVFETHPNSIIRDVAYNEVGSALPQALRLVRCKAALCRHAAIEDLPEESDVMPIGRAEARMLAENAKIARRFEALFSWRCKDRTSRDSKLTNDESSRFQRSLYRLWLYSAVYGIYGTIPPTDIEDEYDDDEFIDAETNRTKRTSFLNSFAPQDLDEMEHVSSFVKEVAVWVIRANRDLDFISDFGDTGIYYGPESVLESYEHPKHPWDWDPERAVDFFSVPLDLIRQERGQGSQQSNGPGRHVILNQTTGENDKCQRCDVRGGLQLWNETNWDYLLGILNAEMHLHLPGRLPYNMSETIPLCDTLLDIRYSTVMARLFSEKEAPFDTLTEQDWLCLDCLTEFINHHLYKWWLGRKHEVGVTIPNEDCWYGYNCRTMVHNSTHAGKLNHLCAPTRGDP